VITQALLADKIISYLNGQLGLQGLVNWAEDAILIFTESDERPANADAIWEALLYIGAADSAGFPLTWDFLKETLEQLGRPVQSIVA
jgi:hypothetical protein